jgi:membrane associated rhomboid family serine protease
VIPLSDIDRRPLSFPVVTSLIIVINSLVFLLELLKGSDFILRWSFIPYYVTTGGNFVTIITAMFMHGGVLHILGNMVYLWAFGPEIEDYLGKTIYISFYLAGGIIAFLAQFAINPVSPVPTLGASGAIAAVMGAFLVAFPHDRIRTLLFLGWFVTISLVPAILLVGFWFLIQFLSEFWTIVEKQDGGGIAYMAHIGGFLFGMGFIGFFKLVRKSFHSNHV